MATITVQDIRDRCDDPTIPDAVVNDYIIAINSQVGTCLDQTYSDGVAKVIQASAVCHLLSLMNNDRLKSFKTPNGTSESYESYLGQDGLGLTGFGKQVLLLDKEGCVSNAFGAPFFIQSVGRTEPSLYNRRNRGNF